MTRLAIVPVAPAALVRRGARAVHSLPTVVRVLMVAVAVLAASGCAGTDIKASYHPPFLPVKLEWGPGGLNITGESQLVTPLGVIAIGAEYPLPGKKADALYVIFRDHLTSPDHPEIAGHDHIYQVDSGAGQFTAVVNGTALIQVTDRQVLIDVPAGTVQTVEFKGAQPIVKERVSTFGEQWQAYWDACFYSPMMLSRWAYDDSTIGDWFGLGFLWFLARLVLAMVLGVVDLMLLVGCTAAAGCFALFGPTGRNMAYGVEALFLLLAWWIVRTHAKV
ncbi:hypothetical protein ACU635_17495 [[Actinomadura] parvosata]|uniref:hypothetical protein n=1 Tax=[Actinomadura] parvosata TaxID=1955412 RepID=UPI00406CE25A